jgi:hypothetical protein
MNEAEKLRKQYRKGLMTTKEYLQEATEGMPEEALLRWLPVELGLLVDTNTYLGNSSENERLAQEFGQFMVERFMAPGTKIVIEVEVPHLTKEEVQQFVIDENDFEQPLDEITPVDAFVTMWTSGRIDYTVTKAEWA